MIYCIIAAVSAYCLGSISFAVIFTKIFVKTDVRSYGSGNAGTTNVLRVAGVLPGILTFVCDGIKGFASAYLGKVLFGLAFPGDEKAALIGALICGIICMLGHSFPVFFGFKGGKCAATCVGIFVCCCPIGISIGLLCFAVTILISGIVSLSTLMAGIVVVIVSAITYSNSPVIIVLCILAYLILLLRHLDNIKRLFNGTEKRLKIKK